MYSSTKSAGPEPPPPPDRSQGYVWPLYRGFEIYAFDPATSREERLTHSDGYDAEATVSPDGSRIVFTSHRDGAFAIYTMNPDGTDVRRVTRRRGYAGGAFFSPDGRRLVYRAFYPRDAAEDRWLDRMLAERALIPFPGMTMEIYVSDADGSHERAITSTGTINFAPSFHPDGRRIVFTSRRGTSGHGSYNLYLVRDDGTGLRRLTEREGFDGFPMFSPDGGRLVFVSDRHASRPHELNLFVADWIENE